MPRHPLSTLQQNKSKAKQLFAFALIFDSFQYNDKDPFGDSAVHFIAKSQRTFAPYISLVSFMN